MICPHCGRDLADAPEVPTTGEFTAPFLGRVASFDAVPPTLAEGDAACSWCGKAASQVRKLLAGPSGARICDGCVALCYTILREDLPDFP